MKRFKSILLYANETASLEAPLRRAEALAATNEASLCVVDVLPESDGPWLTVAGQPELQQTVVTARLRELRTLVAPVRERGVAVEVQVLTGRPFLEIIRQVLHNEHDIVLMTAEANGGGPGQLFGSTALRLLRKCPCPVWVIKSDEDGPCRKILAAVDPGADSSEQQNVSLRVLDLSASLAESDGSEVRIVHCLGPWTSNHSARWLKNVPRRYRHELVTVAKDDAIRRLDELVAKSDLSRVPHKVRLQRGAAADVIAAFSADADLVVMGTLSRSGPVGVLIGNTAEKVLARIDCSVLAVKPEAFITPVQIRKRELVNVGAR